VPARVHGPEVSIFTLKVGDEPLEAPAVGREKRSELGDCELSLVAKLGEDWSVKRRTFELANGKLDFFGRSDFEVQGLGLEVVSHPDHSRFLEILLRGSDRRLGWDQHGTNQSENRLEDDLTLSTNEAEEVTPATHAVDAGFCLTCGHVAVLGHDNLPFG